MKQPLPNVFRDAWAVVGDMQFQCQAEAFFHESHLAGNAGSQNDLRVAHGDTVFQCQGRVVGDIEHRLNELFYVASELGQRGVIVTAHLQTLGKFGQDQGANPLAHLVDIHIAHHLRTAMRGEQAVHQGLQPISLSHNDLGVLGQVTRIQLELQQLRCTADAAQGVFDFVG